MSATATTRETLTAALGERVGVSVGLGRSHVSVVGPLERDGDTWSVTILADDGHGCVVFRGGDIASAVRSGRSQLLVKLRPPRP